MPAPRPRRSSTPPPPERSLLSIPLADAEAQLTERIDAGRALSDKEAAQLDAELASVPYFRNMPMSSGNEQVRALRSKVGQWRDYNQTWLNTHLGGEATKEYEQASTHWTVGGSDDPRVRLDFLHRDIDTEISKLKSIHDRLQFWIPKANAPLALKKTSLPAISDMPDPASDAPIFVVHGSDTLRAESVARTVQQATGRQTIILREQPSLGQTLIEKFEHNAAKASYAVIILTPDDEGGRKGAGNYSPRARQNVILEMGYFYGAIGRNRVGVLLCPGVEKPSDMDGIVYISFDDDGAWKTQLLRELEHANIRTNMSRAF